MARKKSSKPAAKTVGKATAKLPSAWHIFITSQKVIYNNRKLFGVIILAYGLLNILLVGGLQGNLNGGGVKNLSTSFTLFGNLFNRASTPTDDVSNVYQTLLFLYFSLVTIWALRHVGNKSAPRAKEAFYDGIRPLVPFLGVLGIIFLQLIPFLVGNFIYMKMIDSGLAVTNVEKLIWGLMYGALTLLSLYMISSSIFALYIVTLPGLQPMKALKSARNLAIHRRFEILRKVLFLPLIMMILAAVIFIPLIIFVTPIVGPLFFLASMASLIIIHSYFYSVYKELLAR